MAGRRVATYARLILYPEHIHGISLSSHSKALAAGFTHLSNPLREGMMSVSVLYAGVSVHLRYRFAANGCRQCREVGVFGEAYRDTGNT